MSHSTKKTLTIAIILIVLAMSVFGVMVYQVKAQGERLTEQIAILAAHNTQKASYDRQDRKSVV